ncbi:MAG: TrkA family potassium uptake protein, partial [Acidimicrobiales bacterium]
MAKDSRFPFRREARAAGAASLPPPGSEVIVIGLGRFGSALADTLVELGHQVLGVDSDPSIVQDALGTLSHAVQIDATSSKALEQLGVADFPVAVVAIGNDIEASVLTTAALSDVGIPNIWAKAITQSHGRILRRVGAHHVVFPEHDMGQRVAHLVTGRMMDYIELDEGFALVETTPPAHVVGKSLAEAGIRAQYGVTVVCIKPAGEPFTYATPETVMAAEDILLVAGQKRHAEDFANK